MIVIPSKRFVFLRVPRTASTSLSHFLSQNLYHFEDMIHTGVAYANYKTDKSTLSPVFVHGTLTEAVCAGIISEDIAANSRVFAVIRDPVQRFVSFVYHITKTDVVNINEVVNNTFQDIKNISQNNKFMFRPQTNWAFFNDVRVSDLHCYENLDGVTKSIWKYLNLPGSSNLIYNHRKEERKDKKTQLDPILAKEICEFYYQDYELHQKLLRNA